MRGLPILHVVEKSLENWAGNRCGAAHDLTKKNEASNLFWKSCLHLFQNSIITSERVFIGFPLVLSGVITHLVNKIISWKSMQFTGPVGVSELVVGLEADGPHPSRIASVRDRAFRQTGSMRNLYFEVIEHCVCIH
jgi:hypothetical protein